MNAPLERVAPASLDASSLKALDSTNFLVADTEVDLPCRVKLLPGADRLFVMLNGAVDRSKPLPVFARWNWGKVLGGHVLSVCDPTLYLDDELRLGWFVGNRTMDPMTALRRTAETVRSVLGIASDRMVFYGSSGGGFAAMVAAAGLRCGRAIAVNPQTDITHYYPRPVAGIAKVFAPGWTPQRCRDTYPLRWSALAALAEARRSGNDLRLVYAQNLVDKAHHARHFLPFCEQAQAPAAGGVSVDGTVLTHVFSSPEGHGAEPPEVVKYMVAHGLPHLFSAPTRVGT
jgi:hypothetical protein